MGQLCSTSVDAHTCALAVPYYPGGSLYQRNPPMVPMKQQMDWGREDLD